MNIEYIDKELYQRKQKGLFRTLKKQMEGIDFASNDYLGIAQQCSKCEAINGSGASRLISGNYESITKLEEYIANFHQSEAALLYSSGYLANLGLCSTLGRRGVNFIFDEFVHASIRDGLRLAYAKSIKFAHNDLQDLEKKIKLVKSGPIYVFVEALYSMEGDFADLCNILQICKKYSAYLIVDEAHSVGVYGKSGSGFVDSLNLNDQIFARVVTYGKAFGCQGAAVLSTQQLRDYQINFSRPFIYTTAPAPFMVELLLQNYLKVSEAEDQRIRLRENIEIFNMLSTQSSINICSKDSAIKFIKINGNNNAKNLARKLQKAGQVVFPILSPTVPTGSEGLRIVLHSYNKKEEINNLIDLIAQEYIHTVAA